MDYVLYSLLGAIVLFLAVVLIRTLTFKPKKSVDVDEKEVAFDRERAISSLQTLVKFRTVSYKDVSLEDKEAFEALINELPRLYPHVYERCELTRLPDKALLFKWKGQGEGDATVLMAHFDVVPADEEKWEKPPFSGIIEDGVLWGRGTLDTKVTMNGVLSAADHLIANGYTPRRDIYLAFSGGEEVHGRGAVNIVDYFKENNISIGLVVDEGGAVVENTFPGVAEPCALIGIAEKGFIDVQYRVTTSGGHASAPSPHTPVGVLSRACCRIENHPFKAHLTAPVAEMFDTLGRYSTFGYKLIFSNLWCFGGILDLICKKSGGEVNALMRTTVAFTQMEGSQASNVVPTDAKMVSNIRLNPMDTVDSAVKYLKKKVKDDKVQFTVQNGIDPSRISLTDCDEYRSVERAVASTWRGCLVSPYLMVQCSDSRHYGDISDRVYRFSAMALTREERGLIHGNNERITLDAICKAVEFYIRLIELC